MQLENAPKWDKKRRGFYEVWYFKLNQQDRKNALWLRLTTLASKANEKTVAETWGVFFDQTETTPKHIAVKKTYSSDEYNSDNNAITINSCSWADDKTQGKIQSNGHELGWDLKFQKNSAGFSHVPKLFSSLKLNKSTVVTPNPNLLVSGKFSVDGKEYTCENAPAMQGHIYGTKNAIGWAWAHCNLSDDGQPIVMEILTARIKLANLVTSPPLSALYLKFGDEVIEFNSMKESLGIKSEYSLEKWSFEAKRGNKTYRGTITSTPEDFAGVRYEDTDASHLFCHNSKISSLKLEVIENGQVIKTYQCTKSCAFEFVARQKDPRIKLLI